MLVVDGRGGLARLGRRRGVGSHRPAPTSSSSWTARWSPRPSSTPTSTRRDRPGPDRPRPAPARPPWPTRCAAVEDVAVDAAAGIVLGHGLGRDRAGPSAAPPTRAELDRAAVRRRRATSRGSTCTRRWSSSALLAACPDVRGPTAGTHDGRLTARRPPRGPRDRTGRGDRRGSGRRPSAPPGAAAPPGRDRRSTSSAARRSPAPTTSAACSRWRRGRARPEVVGLLGRARRGRAGPRARRRSARRRPVRRRRHRVAHGVACARSTPTPTPPGQRLPRPPQQVRDHVVACTEAGLQAGLPRHRRRRPRRRCSRGFEAAADRSAARTRPGRAAPAGARRDARRRSDRPAARLGVHASVQPAFDALWGGDGGMYAQRLGRRARRRHEPVRRRWPTAGVPLALGSDSPVTPLGPLGRGAGAPSTTATPGQRLAPGRAFAAPHAAGRAARARRRRGPRHRRAASSPCGRRPSSSCRLRDDRVPPGAPTRARTRACPTSRPDAPRRLPAHRRPRPHRPRRRGSPRVSTASAAPSRLDLDPAVVRWARALATQAGAPVVRWPSTPHHRVGRARGAAAGRAGRRRRRAGCRGSTGWSTPCAARSVWSTAWRCRCGTRCAAARRRDLLDAGPEGRRRVGAVPRARGPRRPTGRADGPRGAAAAGIARIDRQRAARERLVARLGDAPRRPWIYLIVATGDIYEDIPQAQAAAREGADVIAVIRSTGQSLLDYVPEGATREGYAGTYATQENFRLMRAALDERQRGARPLRPARRTTRPGCACRRSPRWPAWSGWT